ncbi:enoyl-CoA hydratase/isomerase family protein [Ramlibacter sp.]|uniref:enoyl-CoA hydratase/isomerase family protein n=1 Tax=Ramlibacter sp. TaxID=1917967 RepID=UPI003D146AC5
MSESNPAPELAVTVKDHVTTVEILRGPHNYLDLALVVALAEALEALDLDDDCRAIVLASQGKSFCAGADFSKDAVHRPSAPRTLYGEAIRLFRTGKPIVAAVQGPAIGAGLGLALVADFRVVDPRARFSASFTRLGVHPGFALSATLPRVVGTQNASLLFMTGRRIDGAEAKAMGLADVLCEEGASREAAWNLAAEIAVSAPVALRSARATLRAGLAEAVQAAVEREAAEQDKHFAMADFREGVAAMAERRAPVFAGR